MLLVTPEYRAAFDLEMLWKGIERILLPLSLCQVFG